MYNVYSYMSYDIKCVRAPHATPLSGPRTARRAGCRRTPTRSAAQLAG